LQHTTQYIEEETIDLRELFTVLKRRKKLIGSVTALFTLMALLYVLMAQPIYEVKSNLMVGFIGKDKDGKKANIEEPEVIAKRLSIVFDVKEEIKVKKFISKVSDISISKKIKNFITIKTQAISNDEALKKNKEVVKYAQDLYQPNIDRYIADVDNNIKATEEKIKNLENLETKNLQRKIELLETQKIIEIDEKINFYEKIKIPSLKEKIKFNQEKLEEYTSAVKKLYQSNKKIENTTTIAISSMQMVNYQNLILNSQNKIEDLKTEISLINIETIPNLVKNKKNIQNDMLRKLKYKLNIELPYKKVKILEHRDQLKYSKSKQNIQNSKVIGKYIILDHPIKPKKLLILIAAFITGLMLSVFLAFFMEFLQGTKEK
jgi:capsular polysaccharide biosynthesis protein